MCLNTKISMIISMFYLHDCNWISLVKPCPNVWKCQISFSDFLDPDNWIFLIHYPLPNLTSICHISLIHIIDFWHMESSSKCTYHVKNIFRETYLMIPSYKRKIFLQGFDLLTYLNPCKNEVCFNILSIWTSHMAFLLHVKK